MPGCARPSSRSSGRSCANIGCSEQALPDEEWFADGLALLATMRADEAHPFRFYKNRPAFVARAPGRLDVMGGIADYSGAVVLQFPLRCQTSVVAQLLDEPRCEIVTFGEGQPRYFNGPCDVIETRGLWPRYVLGVARHCRQRARSNAGLRLAVTSTVPQGKGVASSAALEVAAMQALAAAYGVEIAADEMARQCQWAENNVVGAPCGIMDQMTSACGREDRLLRLRCQPDVIEGFIPVPPGYRFYGIDSGLRHAVTGADYTTVRTAAFMGYRMIEDERWNGYLANIPAAEFERLAPRLPERMRGSEFLARYGGTTDPVTQVQADRDYPVRVATAHPVYEQARVERFMELLARPSRDAAIAMGRLMRASHDSYGACGLGSHGTDRLVAMVEEAGPARGVFGAKITGGGSGGTVAILGTDAAERIVGEIADRYAAETGRHSVVFSGSGPGAATTGVLTCS